ncbi:RagB/SusD family nutrient uptake outer membrane protein [Croceivirga thetidis]|uniref:RagB/SusD family nutrient uptake outer membrane protein n=1 Tax=Croceivirga thetidis TaxID=2721623 RepID=A0ABX1GTM0_9FLAO|nr:RagB/SusD family nutrient uptake outer membrane protein [Croceivirga thetidis]NKI33309.1 RagB/SusD family nutrient uptake outer membrane protein [Croceivirga thetidis]
MKKRNLISLCFVLLAIIIGCSDEFTESPAVGALSDDALANDTGVDLLLTGAYSSLNAVSANGFGNGWGRAADNWWIDALSDDAHKGSTNDDQADLAAIELMNWSSNNGYFFARWGELFTLVNRSNAVIALINSLENSGDFGDQLAQARFLRGVANYQLQVMYGNVPFVSAENYAASEFNQPNSGPIWNEVEADFQYGADNLPASRDAGNVGRPTSWTAKAFLGRAHMHQSDWGTALTVLQDVINNGPYALLPEFGDNFRLAGENGTESVFQIQFTTDSGQSFNANQVGALNFPNPGPFGSCCGFYQPTQDLLNAFQTDANGLPLLDTYNQSDVNSDWGLLEGDAFTPFAGNLDPRADYTVGRRGIDYNGYGEHIGDPWIRAKFANNDISGPYLPKKNVYQASEAGTQQATGAWGQQLSGVNYNMLRFADVMLLAAEAAVESGDLATGLNYVNQIRNRAKNSTYIQATDGSGDAANYVIEPYASFPDADYARRAVRFERRLELGMEGHRLFDLRRWGVSQEVLTEYFTNEARTIPGFGALVNPYEPKHDLFPIPIGAIDLSTGALTQNPGY